MQAKFHVESVTKHAGGAVTTFLTPVRKNSNNSENTSFWEATPIGKLEITITNPNTQGFFEAGKEYYLDFSKCENAEA